MNRILLLLAMLVLSFSARATTYYVSDCGAGAAAQCVAGNDANAGTSASSPWKTCDKVTAQFRTLQAGDRILFAKGSAQTACRLYYLSNLNSRKSNPIVLGAYSAPWATGSEGNPILNGQYDQYTLSLMNSGTSTHDEGYVFQDLHFVGAGTTSKMPAIILSNDVKYVTFQRLEINNGRGAIQCEGGTNSPLGIGSDGLTEHVVIRDSNIHHNRGIGILASCNDLLIENNTFNSNGVGTYEHQLYLGDSSLQGTVRTNTQVVIRGNTMVNNSPYASTTSIDPTPGACNGTALVIHGNYKGVIIENNSLSEPVPPTSGGCWGISADLGGYGTVEGFSNIVVRGNSVVNYSMGIGIEMCISCLVENNQIYSEFRGGATGVVAPAKYWHAPVAGNAVTDKLIVRNNTVYLKYPTVDSVGIRVSRDGANHAVASNLIYFGAGTTANTSCFNNSGLATSAFSAFDYNLCYYSATVGRWEITRTTLDVQRAAGFDIHSLNVNPSIPTPASPQFSLAVTSGSVAINSGHPSWSSKFANGGVKRDAAPDMGASEFGAVLVIPSSPTSLGIQ